MIFSVSCQSANCAAWARRRRMSAGGDGPVFPDSLGGWRDPSNTSRDLRDARGSAEFAWVTSHVFRRTAATALDRAGLSARQIADQLGHSRPSITQDYYMGRQAVTSDAARALDRTYRDAFDDDPGRASGAQRESRSYYRPGLQAADLRGKLLRLDSNQ